MILCGCPAPVRDVTERDRLRCSACAGWTPYGRAMSTNKTAGVAADARSLLAQLEMDLPFVEQAAYGLSTPVSGTRSAPGHSDPTLTAAAGQRAQVAAWATVAARMTERALFWLRMADEAAGNALLAADPHRGPDDHTPAPFHDPQALYPGRPDLQAAHAAQARRRGRGEM